MAIKSTTKKPSNRKLPKWKINCYSCGKAFVAKSSGAFYCSKECKDLAAKQRAEERKQFKPRRKMPLPEYVPVAYEILSIKGAMNASRLRNELRKKGFIASRDLANIMDYHGYLLSEDDAGKLYPYKVKKFERSNSNNEKHKQHK